MWKKDPPSVKLCIYIILHSEAQTFNCRKKNEKNPKQNSFWLEGGFQISSSSKVPATFGE